MRVAGRSVPLPFALGMAALVVAGLLLVATASGLINVESLYLFLLGNTIAAISTMVLAALGGAFLGMIAGHHIYASRGFTPFERRVIEALESVEDVEGRVDGAEERLAGEVEELREEVRELRDALDEVLAEGRAP